MGQISVLSFPKHQNPSLEVIEFLGHSRNSFHFMESPSLLPWRLKSCRMSLRRWTSSSDVFDGSLHFRLQHPLTTWIFMRTAVWTSHLAFITVFTRALTIRILSHTDQVHIVQFYLFKIHFNIILPFMLTSTCALFSSFSANKTRHAFFFSQYMSHAPPILSSFIWSAKYYLARNARHAVPHYTDLTMLFVRFPSQT